MLDGADLIRREPRFIVSLPGIVDDREVEGAPGKRREADILEFLFSLKRKTP